MLSHTRAQPIANTEYGVPKRLYWAKLKEMRKPSSLAPRKFEVHTGDVLSRSLGVSAVLTGWITLGLR